MLLPRANHCLTCIILFNLQVTRGSRDRSSEKLNNLAKVTQLLSQTFEFAECLSYTLDITYYPTKTKYTKLAHFESKECQDADFAYFMCSIWNHPFGLERTGYQTETVDKWCLGFWGPIFLDLGIYEGELYLSMVTLSKAMYWWDKEKLTGVDLGVGRRGQRVNRSAFVG